MSAAGAASRVLVIERSYEEHLQQLVSFETEPPATSSPTARHLGPEHHGACVALDQAALHGLWNAAHWMQELTQSERLVMGVFIGQHLIAVASGWLVLDELQIGAVAVMPDQRRRGYGEQVLTTLLRAARQRGAINATLEVSGSNAAAQALYRRSGFTTTGIRRGYYRNGDDALIQWRGLQDMEEVRIAAHS